MDVGRSKELDSGNLIGKQPDFLQNNRPQKLVQLLEALSKLLLRTLSHLLQGVRTYRESDFAVGLECYLITLLPVMPEHYVYQLQ